MSEDEKMEDVHPLDAAAGESEKLEDPALVSLREERRRRFERVMSDVAPLVPEDEDPNVLFRHNWLARGQAVQMVASSGVGKSSMTVQVAMHWAAGEAFLAEPMRPLKCAIIQAEDSERDVAEQIAGMRWGLTTLGGWSEAKFDAVLKKVLCPTCFIGAQGDDFIGLLREFQAYNKCDMLFINPVQAFFGADIADQEAVSRWTRAGIDPIIKDERHACGAFVVCHTTKFTSGDRKGRADVDDYGEYIGAGSHEWLDWVRAKFVFLKHGKSEDYFDFKAPKRGKRLGWTDGNYERTTKKVFKHSEDHIYWQEVTDPVELANIDGPKEDTQSVITDEQLNAIVNVMLNWIRNNRSVKTRELNETSDAFKGTGLSRRQIRAGGRFIKTHWKELHMKFTMDAFGFAEGFRVLERQRCQQAEVDAIIAANRAAKTENKCLTSGRAEDLPPCPAATEADETAIPW